MSDPAGPRRHVKFKAKAAPSQKRPRKPEFKLSQPADSRGSKLWLIGGVVAALALGGYAAMSWVEKPDPHYVAARKLVDSYQAGRAPTARNYNNTIYDQALDELDQVDSDSISAEPAAELEQDILHGREAFLARRRESTRNETATVDKRRERIQLNVEAHLRARANPQVEYPECDKEEGQGDGHEH